MTQTFTPGPWKVLDEVMGEDGNLIDEHYNGIIAGAGYEYNGKQGFTVTGCISRADACMMAAAPELYEALRRAERKLSSLGIEDVGLHVESTENRVTPALQLLRDVRAALAKAKMEPEGEAVNSQFMGDVTCG